MPDGMLYVARDGTITVLDAGQRQAIVGWTPAITTGATFDDDGTDLPYLDLVTDYSLTFLVNEWNASRTGGGLITSSDAASVAAYGHSPQTLSDLPLTDTADVSTITAAMLAKYKAPFQRVLSIKPMMGDNNTLDSVMQLDLGYRVRVLRTPPGGGTRFDQLVWVQKIDITGAPAVPPDVTLGVSPL
jgi:hypothetical protein